MAVTLLGPQRRPAAARAAVAERVPDGQIATINAGWQEREPDTGELGRVLEGRMRNLELWARWQQVLREDAEHARAEGELAAALEQQQRLYTLRLRHALAALTAVARQDGDPEARTAALDDCLRVVRDLDDWHLARVSRLRTDFYLAVRLGERPALRAQREQVAEVVAGCRGVVVTGGHVGVLLHVLHLFDARRLITDGPAGRAVIAWSAGAMACSERVVLYGDFAASGPLDPQYWAEGLGLYPRVLPFPHARRRLDLDDRERLGVLARRFAPRRCLLLADGERVDVGDAGELPPAARTLEPSDPGRSPGTASGSMISGTVTGDPVPSAS
ncbi:hypothetical protein FHX74_001389 [Friedmanniella endophytica]|uniref:Peptidase family S51 n=1 Tax=Microlunatus kandeliicorticis TaxID=1759536 RepID=A0A7W3P5A9_9ACTN|nr:Type 1 glutamine amidotransferase-like domain-containing protein [Microlunatus kandeliicorticis]MBA8793784.1 hypothetical protein [Microlunatus kandeliicorticis]